MSINVFSCVLDMDGVLADMHGHCEMLWGASPLQLGDAQLWKNVETQPTFWLDIPVKAGAYELFELAKPYNPIILTGCPRDGFFKASEQKIMWGAKNFPGVPVITCFSKHKQLHMKSPDDILVDDYIVNVKRWRKAGGSAIWYQNADQAIEELRQKLARRGH